MRCFAIMLLTGFKYLFLIISVHVCKKCSSQTLEYYDGVQILDNILNVESFKHFDIILIKSNNVSTFEQLSQTGINANYQLGKELFSRLQIQFLWGSYLETDINKNCNVNINNKISNTCTNNLSFLKGDSTCRRILVCALFSSLEKTDEFVNKVQNYYKLTHNPRVDCSPIFLLIFKLQLGPDPGSSTSKDDRTEGEVTSKDLVKQKLESMARKFTLASQVYLAAIIKSDSTSKSDLSKISVLFAYEFYMIKNIPIVQEIRIGASTLPTVMSNENPLSNPTVVNPMESLFNSSRIIQKTAKIDFVKILRERIVTRSNFHQAEIIAIAIDSHEFTANNKYYYETINATYRKPFYLSGFNVDELRFLRDALNFSETAATWPIHIIPGKNGRIGGMAIPINAGQADVSLVLHEYVEYRVSGPDALAYTHPIFHNILSVYFKQPPISLSRNIYAECFAPRVWQTLVAVWLLIVVSVIAALALLNTVSLREDNEFRKDAWLWAVGAMTLQGWHSPPNITPVKIFFISGFFFAILVYIAFSSVLVSILSIQVLPVHTFFELASYNFDIFIDQYVPTGAVFIRKLENDGLLRKTNNSRIVSVNTELLENILHSRTAVVSQMDYFEQSVRNLGYTNSRLCPLVSRMQYSSETVLSGFIMKKGNPTKKYLDYKITLMHQSGLLLRYQKHYLLETTMTCLREEHKFVQQLGIEDVVSAFAFYISAIVASIALFASEKIFHIFCRRKQKQIEPKIFVTSQKSNGF